MSDVAERAVVHRAAAIPPVRQIASSRITFPAVLVGNNCISRAQSGGEYRLEQDRIIQLADAEPDTSEPIGFGGVEQGRPTETGCWPGRVIDSISPAGLWHGLILLGFPACDQPWSW